MRRVGLFAIFTLFLAAFTLNVFSVETVNLLQGKILVENGAGAAGEGAGQAAIDINKLNHIFGKAEHGLDRLLEGFGGNQAQAFGAIQNAAQQQITAQGITGVFERAITVGSTQITVRGAVIDGVVKVGTAFIP